MSALLSYEVERRSVGGAGAADAVSYPDFYRKRSPLLRFAATDGKAASMTTFALQVPCLRLAAIHSLKLGLAEGADIRVAMCWRARLLRFRAFRCSSTGDRGGAVCRASRAALAEEAQQRR